MTDTSGLLLGLTEALSRLSASGQEYATLFEHGTLSIGVYQPAGVDNQQPHTRDEVYVVISGSGVFLLGEESIPFQPGEMIFVPAGVEHRFAEFTEDLVAWVMFYGPEGGEAK